MVGQFRAAGLGDPISYGQYSFSLMWHVEGSDEHRPCPGSPVWQGFGCYDAVVERDRQQASASFGWPEAEPEPEPRDHLLVHTEGGVVVDVPWPDDPAEFRRLLHDAGQRIAEVVAADIARFETDNGGHLPGTEPR